MTEQKAKIEEEAGNKAGTAACNFNITTEQGLKNIEGVFLRDDLKIVEFKSYLLTLTDGEPFYLKYHMKNSDTILDLKNRTKEQN